MKSTSTIFTVTGGKGGIGKSLVAVNLAETLAADGHRVALLDADLHLGACALLLNETPAATLHDLARRKVVARDVCHPAASGVTLIQSAAPLGSEPEVAPRRLFATLDRLLATLRHETDYIVIDTPAGIDLPVRWALDRADLGLVVLVGEPTAITDAYRLCKLTWQADPDFPLATLVNAAESEDEAASVSERFNKITEQFLHTQPLYLGWVPFSETIRNSVRLQRPAVRDEGPARDAFGTLAHLLVQGRCLPTPTPIA